jgi:hypothetical protein
MRKRKTPGGQGRAQTTGETRQTSAAGAICNCDHSRGKCCTCCCPGSMAGKVAVELTRILKLLKTGRTSEGIALLQDLRDELAESFWAAHRGACEAA